MHALPYLSASMADELLKGTRRLNRLTHEDRVFDWERFDLTCSHGVRVQVEFALYSVSP